MTPILFEANATTFTSYGIGALVDAISCQVTMDSNTQYELQMEYPCDGELFSEITGNRIIYAKPCQTDNPQPFRIYRMTKPIGGKVTFYARHISYDLLGIPVTPFKSTSASDFCSKIAANSAITNPFTFTTNISKTEDLEFDEPQSARYLLSDNDQSWAKVYGGELVFDGYDVKLQSAAGQNRGVAIRYGVDLIDSKMEENINGVYSGILPYFYEDNVLVMGTVQNVTGTFLVPRVLLVDVSEYIASSNPSQSDVNSVGQTWLSENLVGLPEISLTLSYAQMDQVARLFDTVTVKIERLGIDVLAKISRTVYDVLKERNISINVGDVRPTFAEDMYNAARLKTGLLDMKRIKDKSITNSKMGSGSVGTDNVQDSAVTTGKLNDNAVTSNKIIDGAIVAEKIVNGAVIREKINDGAVSEEKTDFSGYFHGTKHIPKLVVYEMVTTGGDAVIHNGHIITPT